MAYEGAGILFYHIDTNGIRILLGKRNFNPQKGLWSIPGGKKELTDKSFLDAAWRETCEEIGLYLTSLREKKVFQLNPQTTPSTTVVFPFLFDFKTFMVKSKEKFNAPKRTFELNDLQWFDIEDLPSSTHPGVKFTASKLKKRLIHNLDNME